MNAQRGFTLIELLIAMSIAAVISLLAYRTIDSSVRVDHSLEAHQQQLRQLQSAWWWLEQDLIQMAPRAVSDGLGGTLPAMSYRLDLGLEFSRFSDAQSPLAIKGSYGMGRVAYLLDGKKLLRLQWSVMDRAPDTQPSRRVLLDNVQNFELRFLDEENRWYQNWPPESRDTPVLNNMLPKAVEVRLVTGLGEVRRLMPGSDWVAFNPYPSTSDAAEPGRGALYE